MFLGDDEDPANCLSLGGVFVEGAQEHFPQLRAKFASREDVKLMLEPGDPESLRSF